jgi:hypothetical protein
LETLTNKITLVTARAYKNSKPELNVDGFWYISSVAEKFPNITKESRMHNVIAVMKTIGPIFPIKFATSSFNKARSFAAAVKMLSKSNKCLGAQSNKALICLAF